MLEYNLFMLLRLHVKPVPREVLSHFHLRPFIFSIWQKISDDNLFDVDIFTFTV